MAKTFEAPRRQVQPKYNQCLDLNTDFGQSSDRAFFEGKEKTLLNYVSSVNIPCAVHDSDPAQVQQDIKRAKQLQCAVGAHIAYPDPKHYGYQALELSEADLTAWILMQLGGFSALCRANHTEIQHIRPHGALYTQMITDEAVALTVAKAVALFDPWTALIVPLTPVLSKLQAQVNIPYAPELYLGKRVGPDGVLVLDKLEDNMPPQGVIEQVKQLAQSSSVTTEDGQTVKVPCKTMHISPKLQGNMMIAERINAMLGKITALSLGTAGNSGWL